MKITEDLVKEREMIISSLEAELTSYKNEVNGLAFACLGCSPQTLGEGGLGPHVFVWQTIESNRIQKQRLVFRG